MGFQIIQTESDHQKALKRISDLMDLDPEVDTAEDYEIEVLSLLIETYEKKHFPMERPSPVDAILFRMDQLGMT